MSWRDSAHVPAKIWNTLYGIQPPEPNTWTPNIMSKCVNSTYENLAAGIQPLGIMEVWH